MATTHVLELIDIGDLPNDGTGDPLRVAFQKINTNFESIPLLNQGGANQSIRSIMMDLAVVQQIYYMTHQIMQ